MYYQNKETEEKLPFIIDLTFSKNIPVPGIKFSFIESQDWKHLEIG
jgi:hypothetical protein